jgi:lysozyme family protein
MASFDKAIAIVQKNEGFYSDDRKDVGNYYPQNFNGTFIGTNHGITPTTYREYFGYTPTIAQMKALTKAQSNEIYKKLYWNKISGDKINNQSFANILLDSVVNQGVSKPVKAVQSIVGVKQDGGMGKNTVTAVNLHNQKTLFDNFKQWRIDTYAKGNPTYSNAWIKRVNKFQFAIGIGAILLLVGIAVVLFISYQKRAEIAKAGQNITKAI